MKKIILTVLIAVSGSAQAGVAKFAYIDGVIISWTESKVKLRLPNGRTRNVDRSSIPEYYDIKEGRSVTAYISRDKFLADNLKK